MAVPSLPHRTITRLSNKMKKTLLSLAFALSGSLSAMAQQQVGTFSIIPRIGVSIANMTQNEFVYDIGNAETSTMKSKYKTGLLLGADFEYQFHPVLSASLGAYYSSQGCRYSNYNIGDEDTGEYSGYDNHHTNVQYLNVPLMLNAYVAEGFSLKVGVQMGFLLDSESEYDETPFTIKKDGTREHGETKTVALDASYRKTDISIPVGFAYEYMNVVLDARYNISLTKLSDVDVVKSKNSVFTVSVGYRFAL